MSKKSPLPKSRRHVSLYDDDWAFLESLYGSTSNSPNPLGTGQAICQIVHGAVTRLRAKYQERRDGTAVPQEGVGEAMETTNGK